MQFIIIDKRKAWIVAWQLVNLCACSEHSSSGGASPGLCASASFKGKWEVLLVLLLVIGPVLLIHEMPMSLLAGNGLQAMGASNQSAAQDPADSSKFCTLLP